MDYLKPYFVKIKTRIKKIVYRDQEPRRYKYLFKIISENKCQRIMEIGTWNGEHAFQMIESAKKHSEPENVEYYGFDLFESFTDKHLVPPFVTRVPPALHTVKEKLERTKANIHLYKGSSQKLLPRLVSALPKMDFIYIDGDHKPEAIAIDWKYAQKLMHDKTIVVFDDYWNMEKAGCKTVVENINKKRFDVEILPIQDKFKKEFGILKINFAKVKINKQNKKNYQKDISRNCRGAY